jgi:hypothetical protein
MFGKDFLPQTSDPEQLIESAPCTKEAPMSIQEIYVYHLRTSESTVSTGYCTVDDARTALKHLIDVESRRGHDVGEQSDGRWLSRQKPEGSVTMWIETEDGTTIAIG